MDDDVDWTRTLQMSSFDRQILWFNSNRSIDCIQKKKKKKENAQSTWTRFESWVFQKLKFNVKYNSEQVVNRLKWNENFQQRIEKRL